MQQIQQAKEGLLVYLEANRQYIEQKVYNEFNIECIEQKKLNTLDIPKMINTIKDIFDFGDNKVYEYFFSHMESNIKEYIASQYKQKAVDSFYLLDVEKLTDIVKFCILHGFDEEAAKRKDQEKKKKQAKQKQPPPPPPQSVIIKNPQPERKREPPKEPEPVFANVKPRISTFIDPSLIPEKKQFKLEKFSMPEKNVLPRYLMSIPKAQVTPKEEEPTVIVAPIDQSYLIAHRKAIRDRLLKLFNFYCVQQQNLGSRPTFDRIKGQGEAMSLGKFMQFCQYTKVFNCKELTKDMLMIEFKKVAEGKMEIDFDLFEKLITLLDQKYLKEVGHDPVNNPMPTYEARLFLNQPNRLGELKKQRNLVFGTRSKEAREPNRLNTSLRYDHKELTAHSGRFSEDLSSDLKLKSLEKLNDLKVKAKTSRKSLPGAINLSDLTKLKLPKLPWIDEEEDNDNISKFGSRAK